MTGPAAPRAWGRWAIVGALAVAVVVALVVIVVRTPTFVATSTGVASVQPVAGRAGTTPTEVARVVAGLAATAPVLDATAAGSGVPRDEVADALEVDASDAGIVTVVATASDPQQAARLADAAVTALDQELVRTNEDALRESLAPLQGQMQQLTAQLQVVPLGDPNRAALEQNYGALAGVIADRTAAPAPQLLADGPPVVAAGRSPVADALLAALAVLVLAGVAALIVRSARHRPARRDSALALARVDGPHAVLYPGDDVPAVLTRLYAEAVRGRGSVLVLQLSEETAHDVGADLVAAGWIVGECPAHRDLTPALTPGARPPVPAPPAPIMTISSLRRPRIDGPALALLREAGVRAALIAVDTHRALPARLADAVSTLEGLAVELRGVVVWRGRLPASGLSGDGPTTTARAPDRGGPPGAPSERPDPTTAASR